MLSGIGRIPAEVGREDSRWQRRRSRSVVICVLCWGTSAWRPSDCRAARGSAISTRPYCR